MRIAFFAGNGIPVHAYTLNERSLGGTETALIRVASALSKLGHKVTVFTSEERPPDSEPRYLPARRFLEQDDLDRVIFVQDWKPVLMGVKARRSYFWTGDGYDQFKNFGIGDLRAVNKFDGLFAVSKWQAETLSEKSGFPIEKIYVVRNGVHLPYFEDDSCIQKARKRLIYSSAPYRGLEFVPGIFEKLKLLHPDVELHVFSGMDIYDGRRPFSGPLKDYTDKLLAKLKTIEGCVVQGSVKQSELAHALMQAAILIYPNKIYETSCIAAIEALAAGCPVVCGRNSGLVESVGQAGILIDDLPGSAEYIGKFVEAVNALLSDDNTWKHLSTLGRNRAFKEYGWESVAMRMEAALK